MIRKPRLKISEIVMLIVFTLIMFQNALMKISGIFAYIDEFLFMISVGYIVYSLLRYKSIHRDDLIMFLLMILIAGLGILCNFTSDIDRSLIMIILDLVYFFKDFICFIGAYWYFSRNKISNEFKDVLAKEVKAIILIAFVCLILSQFVNIGMTRGTRYGFKCFKFVYTNSGMFSQYCIIFLIILTVGLQNLKDKRNQLFYLGLLMIIWISTFRSRAFVSIAIWCVLMFISKKISDHNLIEQGRKATLKYFLKPHYILIAIVIIVALGWSQVQTYFGGEVSARSLLLIGGIAIMKDYFPLGSGFGTFGTQIAATYYSPLYYRYGLNTFKALAENGSELTDCYWPAVGAELGIIGIILMAALIFVFSKRFIQSANHKKYHMIAFLTYVIYLLVSSTATGIYTSYLTAGFLVICMAIINTKEEEKYGNDSVV